MLDFKCFLPRNSMANLISFGLTQEHHKKWWRPLSLAWDSEADSWVTHQKTHQNIARGGRGCCAEPSSFSQHYPAFLHLAHRIRVPRYNTENVIRVPRYNTENVIMRCAVQKSPRIFGEIWVFWSNICDFWVIWYFSFWGETCQCFVAAERNALSTTNTGAIHRQKTLNISSASHHQLTVVTNETRQKY